jgi:hypothetical protein
MSTYPDATREALARAVCKRSKSQTRQDRIMLLLRDGEWVDSLDLALRGGGLDFCARICELRKSGVRIETRRHPQNPKGENWHQYRLVTDDEVPQKG